MEGMHRTRLPDARAAAVGRWLPSAQRNAVRDKTTTMTAAARLASRRFMRLTSCGMTSVRRDSHWHLQPEWRVNHWEYAILCSAVSIARVKRLTIAGVDVTTSHRPRYATAL